MSQVQLTIVQVDECGQHHVTKTGSHTGHAEKYLNKGIRLLVHCDQHDHVYPGKFGSLPFFLRDRR